MSGDTAHMRSVSKSARKSPVVRAVIVTDQAVLDMRGRPIPLPAGVTPWHVARALDLFYAGDCGPIRQLLPSRCIPTCTPAAARIR